jgi:hypothetical protein
MSVKYKLALSFISLFTIIIIISHIHLCRLKRVILTSKIFTT